MNPAYFYLLFAVAFETIGTTLMKASDAFTKPLPTIGSIASFIVALYLMSLTLRVLPVGLVYAVWSGLGIVLITVIGLLYFKQTLDLAGYLGVTLILLGVIVLFGFSEAKA